MKQKLSEHDQYFWKNLGQAFTIFVASGIGMTIMLNVDSAPHTPLNWIGGFGYVSFFATIILIFKVAQDMTNIAYPDKLDEEEYKRAKRLLDERKNFKD